MPTKCGKPTNLVCVLDPPVVALTIAHAASLFVLKSPVARTLINDGIRFASITHYHKTREMKSL